VLIAVTRQAAVNRNEAVNGITSSPPEEKTQPPPTQWRKGA
jgi:hypothetical protein